MRQLKNKPSCECDDKQPKPKGFLIDGPIIGKCCDGCYIVLEWRKATPEEIAAFNGANVDPAQTQIFDNPPVAKLAAVLDAVPVATAETAPAPTQPVNTSWPAEDEPEVIGEESYLIKDIYVGNNPPFIRVHTPIGSVDLPTTEVKAQAAFKDKAIFVGKTGTFEVSRKGLDVKINKMLRLA